MSGIGSVSARSVGSVRDEPLFLSRARGVCHCLERADDPAQRAKPLLLCRPPRSRASPIWSRRWPSTGRAGTCCASGTTGYVLDGNQKRAYRSQSENDYVYECYHWNGIPARCFLEVDGALFFGTAEGAICRFNNDLEGVMQYHDNGSPIVCQWSTKGRRRRRLPRAKASAAARARHSD